MHKRLLNEAILDFTIVPDGPILIKAGDTGADPTRPDMEFVRTWYDGKRVVYLPGPSLKGVIRSHCERIARTVGEGRSCNPVVKEKSCVKLNDLKQEHNGVHVHSRSCFICQMFGNTVLAGRVRTKDAYPVNPDDVRTEERNGVAIDRVFGSVAVGPFQMEVVTVGEFQTRIAIRNFTIAQLGLLALALRDLKLGRVGVGFGKSRGLGHVTLEWDTLTVRYTRPPQDKRRLDGVAYILGGDEAASYGYVAGGDKPFGYRSADQDASSPLSGLALAENDWGEWELTAINWRFYLLGELRVVYAGRQVPPPPPCTHSLLAALLLNPRPQQRVRLVGLLFPDMPEQKGRRRLSDRLWLLRRTLPDLPLLVNAGGIEIPAPGRWLDVDAFGQNAATSDLAGWQAALALYRGDLLPGCFDDWLLLEREALHLEYIQLLMRTCRRLLEYHHVQALLPLAQRLVQEEPFDEEALRMLMRAHAALGQRGAALAAYERFVALAADELGIEPGEATRSLAQGVRAAAPALIPPPPLPDDSSPDHLLRLAQTALERGDRLTVGRCLDRLKSTPLAADEIAHRLLQIDLALLCGDHDLAGRILETCPLDHAAIEARTATLALARGQGAVAHAAASRALLLAHDAQNLASELEALLVLARAQLKLGRGARALATAGQALSLARQCASPSGAVRALLVQGLTLYRQGQCRAAIPIFYEARSLAHEHGLHRYLAEALHGLANARSDLGIFVEPLDTLQQALSIWRDLGLQHKEASTLQSLSSLYDLLGRGAEAQRTLERARQIYERIGDPLGVARSKYHLAAAIPYHDEAEAARAIALAGDALDTFREHDQPGWEAAALAAMGYAQWIDGQHTAALDAFHRAYTLYQRRGEIRALPELLAYQGLAHLGLGNRTEALDCTRRALLALAQGPSGNDIVSEIYYAHAVVLEASGQEEQAHKYLGRAYNNLLDYAAQLEDESARRAFFRRDPTVRRLMEKVYECSIAPRPDSGVVTRWLPPRTGPARPPVPVEWTLDAGPPDASLQRSKGAIALRRERLARVLRESRTQGARPTIRQLAADFGVSPRTIKRDLAVLRKRET